MATREWRLDCKVYIGDLGDGAEKEEIEDAFSRYGELRNVWIARRPPGFAFVEFADPRDALDACRALDGTRMNGRRVKVEMSSGRARNDRGRYRGYDRRSSPPRYSRRSRSRSRSPRRRYRSRSRSR